MFSVGVPTVMRRQSAQCMTEERLRTMTVSRALDRIADHTAILGSRLRYLITGDPGDLAAEVR